MNRAGNINSSTNVVSIAILENEKPEIQNYTDLMILI